MTEMQFGQIVLLLTTVTGFVVQAWREARNRKWAIADRRAELEAQTAQLLAEAQARAAVLLLETETKAKVLHLEQIARADQIRTDLAAHDEWERQDKRASEAATTQVVALIGEAKDAAHEAYKEANHVNIKIEDLNKRLVKQGEETTVQVGSTGAQIDTIEATTSRIEARQKAKTK